MTNKLLRYTGLNAAKGERIATLTLQLALYFILQLALEPDVKYGDKGVAHVGDATTKTQRG
jgi:hypothetical protein